MRINPSSDLNALDILESKKERKKYSNLSSKNTQVIKLVPQRFWTSIWSSMVYNNNHICSTLFSLWKTNLNIYTKNRKYSLSSFQMTKMNGHAYSKTWYHDIRADARKGKKKWEN